MTAWCFRKDSILDFKDVLIANDGEQDRAVIEKRQYGPRKVYQVHGITRYSDGRIKGYGGPYQFKTMQAAKQFCSETPMVWGK